MIPGALLSPVQARHSVSPGVGWPGENKRTLVKGRNLQAILHRWHANSPIAIHIMDLTMAGDPTLEAGLVNKVLASSGMVLSGC